MKIQIVTDSTAYVTKEYLAQTGVKVAPLNVHFEDQVFEEGYPGEFHTFFDRLKVSKDFPKTSQPASETFLKIYEDAFSEDKEVIVIVLSSELSGTYNSAFAAAQMTASPEKVSIIDSLTTSVNLRTLVERAHTLAEEGLSRDEIVKILDFEKQYMTVNLTVDTLEYLKRGGRLSGAKAMIATVLDLRPILAVINGKLEPVGKARGRKKSIDMMLSSIPEGAKKVGICHIFSYDEACEVKSLVEARYPEATVVINEIGPVIGSHLGPKALGILSSM